MLKSEEFAPPIEIDLGRIENRKYYLISNLKHLSKAEEWKNLRSIIMVDSERIQKKTGEVQRQVRYFISSLKDVEKSAIGIEFIKKRRAESKY